MKTKRELIALKEKHNSIRTMAKVCGVPLGKMEKWMAHHGLHQPKMQPDSIPTAVFAPLLRKMIDEWEMSPLMPETVSEGATMGPGRVRKLDRDKKAYSGSKLDIIASTMQKEGRVSARRLSAILRQESLGVSYGVVDRLLCFFDQPFLWYQEPLRHYYWEGNPPKNQADPDIAAALAGLR